MSIPSAFNTVAIVPPPPIGGPAVFAMTPGGLGYNMRAAKNAGDNRISSGPTSTSNNPASNGPCN